MKAVVPEMALGSTISRGNPLVLGTGKAVIWKKMFTSSFELFLTDIPDETNVSNCQERRVPTQ